MTKKLSQLERLRFGSLVANEIRERAIDLGVGNPRLLEWLNRVLADENTDAAVIINAIENKAEVFRERVVKTAASRLMI